MGEPVGIGRADLPQGDQVGEHFPSPCLPARNTVVRNGRRTGLRVGLIQFLDQGSSEWVQQLQVHLEVMGDLVGEVDELPRVGQVIPRKSDDRDRQPIGAERVRAIAVRRAFAALVCVWAEPGDEVGERGLAQLVIADRPELDRPVEHRSMAVPRHRVCHPKPIAELRD